MQGMLSSIGQHLLQLAGWLQPVAIAVGVVCGIAAWVLYQFTEEQHHKAKKWLINIVIACACVMIFKPFVQGVASFFGGFGGGF